MSSLNLTQNVAQPDEIYDLLVAAHHNLSDEQSMMLNAKLILILVNHVGDAGVVTEAIRLAKAHAASPA